MKAITTAFIIILVVSVFNSCYYDNEEFLYGAGAACTDTISSYTGRLKSIIQNECFDCHNQGSSDGDFSTFQLVHQQRDGIICRVVNSPSCGPVMPQDGSISDCDKNAFLLWQQNGFRE
jgi:hypothetical protein